MAIGILDTLLNMKTLNPKQHSNVDVFSLYYISFCCSSSCTTGAANPRDLIVKSRNFGMITANTSDKLMKTLKPKQHSNADTWTPVHFAAVQSALPVLQTQET